LGVAGEDDRHVGDVAVVDDEVLVVFPGVACEADSGHCLVLVSPPLADRQVLDAPQPEEVVMLGITGEAGRSGR